MYNIRVLLAIVPKHHSLILGLFWASRGLDSQELSQQRSSVWASLSFREDAIEGLATVAILLISLQTAVQELQTAGFYVVFFHVFSVSVGIPWHRCAAC